MTSLGHMLSTKPYCTSPQNRVFSLTTHVIGGTTLPPHSFLFVSISVMRYHFLLMFFMVPFGSSPISLSSLMFVCSSLYYFLPCLSWGSPIASPMADLLLSTSVLLLQNLGLRAVYPSLSSSLSWSWSIHLMVQWCNSSYWWFPSVCEMSQPSWGGGPAGSPPHARMTSSF